jgi:hypothetical protein
MKINKKEKNKEIHSKTESKRTDLLTAMDWYTSESATIKTKHRMASTENTSS